jgi:hypothetical protein
MLGNLKARTTAKMCAKNFQIASNCGSWASPILSLTRAPTSLINPI